MDFDPVDLDPVDLDPAVFDLAFAIAMRKVLLLPVLSKGPVIDLSDETGAAIAGHIDPKPAQCHRQPIAQPDQEVDVRHPPDPPGDPPSKLAPAEVNDRGTLADGRKITGMPVAKGSGLRISRQPALDRARDMSALLLGGGRDAGRCFSVPNIDRGGVTHD